MVSRLLKVLRLASIRHIQHTVGALLFDAVGDGSEIGGGVHETAVSPVPKPTGWREGIDYLRTFGSSPAEALLHYHWQRFSLAVHLGAPQRKVSSLSGASLLTGS